MPDRENVIYDIERCICHVPDACRDCSHYGHGEAIGCMEELLTDALAMLKECDAVEPKVSSTEQRCGNCNNIIEMDGWKVCPWCGKRIDWEGWWKKNGTCN